MLAVAGDGPVRVTLELLARQRWMAERAGGSVSCRSYVRQLQAAADVAVARWPALAGAPFVAAGGQAGAPADTDWWQQLTPARLVALADARFDRPDWTAALLPVLA